MRSPNFAMKPRMLFTALAALVLAGCVMAPKPYNKPATPVKPVQTGKFW